MQEPLTLDGAYTALKFISPDLSRDEWFEIGAALKDEFGDSGFDLFDQWSQGGASYQRDACKATWRSARAGHYTIATLIKRAQAGGWKRERKALTNEQRAALATQRAEERAKHAAKEAEAKRHGDAMAQALQVACADVWANHTTDVGRSDYLRGPKKKLTHHKGCRFADKAILLRMDEKAETVTTVLGSDVMAKLKAYNALKLDYVHIFKIGKGELVVPLMQAGQVVSLQRINSKGDKFFPKFATVAGSSMVIGELAKDKPAAVVEGYATGAAVHQATGWPVLVTFNAGNMLRATALWTLKAKPKFQGLVWAVDKDAPKDGATPVGLEAGRKGQVKLGGVIAEPKLANAETGDWADVLAFEGEAVAKQQLFAALEALRMPAKAKRSPAPASQTNGAAGAQNYLETPTLKECLRRFVWTVPKGHIYDNVEQRIMLPKHLRGWVGKPIYNEWANHTARRAIEHSEAVRLTQDAAARNPIDTSSDLGKALNRFALIYPSQNAWDKERHELVPLVDLKAYLGDNYTKWQNDNARLVIQADHLVFDPKQLHSSEDGYINTFRGLSTKPVDDMDACQHIRQLVWRLCNENNTNFEFLMCWLAYPLQNLGVKLATGVIFHGNVQGAGKSLFFDGVMKKIYGEYGTTVGQHQMESQYTAWRSRLLYALFEEVVSARERYNVLGNIKHLITGTTQRIEKKFMTGWEEANYMQSVFLSNEEQPVPLESRDRRFFVVNPRTKAPKELTNAVGRELENGGVEAFYGFLMRWPMEWTGLDGVKRPFDVHTEPPLTPDKQRVIEFGLPGWETFLNEWQRGEYAEFEYECCRMVDLYDLYKRECKKSNWRPLSKQKFSIFVSGRVRRKKDVRYDHGGFVGKSTFFIVDGDVPDDGQTMKDFLGLKVYLWDRNLHGVGESD